jgi:AraC-like DNA-binding protein
MSYSWLRDKRAAIADTGENECESMNEHRETADKLETFFRTVEEVMDITITFHDLSGAFRFDDDFPLLKKERTIHSHPICLYAHTKQCLLECHGHANSRAASGKEPFRHSCWKGVDEIVMPVFRNGMHIGTLFAGCFRSKQDVETSLTNRSRSTILRLREELTFLEAEKEARISRMLELLSQALLRQLDELQKLQDYSDSRKRSIANHIRTGLQQKTTLSDLASHINLSKSRTSHLVKELFGESMKSLVLKERIARSKHLLLNTDIPVSAVAERVGVSDIHYFTKLFKKAVGAPPGTFRKKNKRF